MKRKIASIITALIMIGTVTLIIGCKPPQGNTKNSDSGNTASSGNLQGVWKVTAEGRYMTHIYFDGSTMYAATNATGSFVKYPRAITYNKNGGTLSVAGQTYKLVKNGANIDLQINGVTTMTMTKDSSVSADTIKNATANPTPNPKPNPTPNPKPNPTPNPEPNPTPNPKPNPTPNPKPPVPNEPEIDPEDVPVPLIKDDWITLSKNVNYLIIRWYVKSEEELPDSYNIYRSETKNGDYVCIKKEYSGSSKDLGTYVRCEYDETSADIKTSGKSYYYRISAVCQGVEGKQSEPKGITITPPKAYATGGQCKIKGILLPSKAKDSIVISENNREYKTRYKKKNGEWSQWVYWTYDTNFKPLCAYEINCKTGVVQYDTSQMIRFEK